MATAAVEKKGFDYNKTLILGFGFLGISVIWPIFNRFIPIILQAGDPTYERQLLEAGREIPNIVGFGVAPSLAFFIMTWDNLINVFVQPWVGERSDRTWNRFGRRKGWILMGAPLAAIAFVLVPFAQSLLALAIFILITNFGMALFRSPTVAWLGDLFEPDDRSKANGIINLMGGIGFVVALFGLGPLFDSVGRAAPFIGGAILLLAAVSVAVLKVKEPTQIEVEAEVESQGVLSNLRTLFKSKDRSGVYVLLGILFWFTAWEALDTGLSSFAVFSLGIPAGRAAMLSAAGGAAFILFAIPAGNLGSRLGRRRTILIGLTGLAVLFPAGYFLVQGTATFVIVLVLAGILWACVNVNSLPLVYDYGNERRIGAFTGLYYFSSQSAAVLGPTLGGVLVDILNNQFRVLFLFSALFMTLALIAITRVRKESAKQ
ncbi:MAG: MFS transporter [Anaerolineae bacterium]